MNPILTATDWVADTEHCTAAFRVGHIGGHVHGAAPVLAGLLTLTPDGRPITAAGVVDLAAIDTGNPRRDRDLRKPRLLDLDGHPRTTFTAEDITADGPRWRVAGVAAVRGRAVPLIFTVDTFDITDTAVTVTASAVLDRTAFGLRAPSLLIGRWVDITVRVVLRPALQVGQGETGERVADTDQFGVGARAQVDQADRTAQVAHIEMGVEPGQADGLSVPA
ncbi:polyisoprenoid-binding protein YceI [Nocardia caishijiensis]|uniref:Polyisoprenoid-binding protein YceI n=1 Tax=Nocardia caishijiensis TaxID=184756 RepID=A0ABQ6YV25_9NOCA|nr:polyisoprenoid-binding protein YceI [Nocardia caishijiensis]